MLRKRLRSLLVALVPVLLVAVPHASAPAASPPPNIVLIQIDTLRQDHVGCYGYRRPTTPNLDRFARSGVTFRNAYSVTSWTLPAVASLLTGLRPSQNGVRAVGDQLPDSMTTLAQELNTGGYNTVAVSANFAFVHPGSNYPDPPLHFQHGFNTFQVLIQPAADDDREGEVIFGQRMRTVRADTVTSRMNEFVSTSPEPFFLFAVYMDVHYGYEPPRDYAKMFEPASTDSNVTGYMQDVLQLAAPLGQRDIAHLTNLYDGEIRYTDEYIGDFLATLDDAGLADRTIVVILSDHGEAFGEHGRMLHGQTLYEQGLRVPLMMRGPGIPSGVTVETPVSITDIMPTLLDLVDIPSPDGLDGQSLTPTWQRPWWRRAAPRDLRFELDNETELLNGPRRHTRALRRGDWKLIRSLDGSTELYNLDKDPGEKHDLAATETSIAAGLNTALGEEGAPASGATPRPTVTNAERERLHALGYLQGTQ
jgi:arylsulfatase A-like enzyme